MRNAKPTNSDGADNWIFCGIDRISNNINEKLSIEAVETSDGGSSEERLEA